MSEPLSSRCGETNAERMARVRLRGQPEFLFCQGPRKHHIMGMFKRIVQRGRSENLPTPHTSHKGSGRGFPFLRASNEHIPIMLLLSLLVASSGMGAD